MFTTRPGTASPIQVFTFSVSLFSSILKLFLVNVNFPMFYNLLRFMVLVSSKHVFVAHEFLRNWNIESLMQQPSSCFQLCLKKQDETYIICLIFPNMRQPLLNLEGENVMPVAFSKLHFYIPRSILLYSRYLAQNIGI